MGEKTGTGDKGLIREVDTATGGTGAGGKRNSVDNSNTGTGRGTGTTGTGAGAGTSTGVNTEKEVNTGLAILTEEEKAKYETADDKEKKRILRNAKRRQKYAEEKGGTVQGKPRKVTKKKQETQTVDTAGINMLIGSLSAVISSREGCEHWLLTEKEINSISEPLSKMLAESTALEKLGEYSNQIALVTACTTIFVPRLIITASKKKEVKKIARTGQQTNTTVTKRDGEKLNTSKQTGENIVTNRRNVENITSNGTNNSYSEPWFGSPLC